MKKKSTKNLVTAGMLLAVGILLPLVTAHGFGMPGTVLLPMHIPVFLPGLISGPAWGSLLGASLPIINSLITGMPALYPNTVIMTFELLTYGLSSGLIYRNRLKKKIGRLPTLFIAIISAMILGRAAYGAVFALLFSISGGFKMLTVFSAIATGLVGIIIQILLLPAITLAAEALLGKGQK